MKRILIYCLKNSNFILGLYNSYFRLKNRKKFWKENNRRFNLSIFDYIELAKEIPYYPIEKIKDSNYYGHANALKKYAGIEYLPAAIEHGIYLSGTPTYAEKLKTTNSIITMSDNRVKAIESSGINKKVLAIGPYIHYANSILSEPDFHSIKHQIGKTLLVMPSHSVTYSTVKFDIEKFIDFINTFRNEYQTIMVCLHYNDVQKNPQYTNLYIKQGYRITCAGHRYDLNFINRLKTIILLSDYVVANSFGTNTGYCTFLNKPQTIYQDTTVQYSGNVGNMISDLEVIQTKEIENIFNEVTDNITIEQREIIAKYWGTEHVMSRDTLKKYILSL